MKFHIDFTSVFLLFSHIKKLFLDKYGYRVLKISGEVKSGRRWKNTEKLRSSCPDFFNPPVVFTYVPSDFFYIKLSYRTCTFYVFSHEVTVNFQWYWHKCTQCTEMYKMYIFVQSLRKILRKSLKIVDFCTFIYLLIHT